MKKSEFTMYNQLLRLRGYYNYVVKGLDVYVIDVHEQAYGSNPIIRQHFDPPVWVGSMEEICDAPNMHTVVNRNLRKGLTKSVADLEAVERRARLDGEKYAGFLLWMNGAKAATMPGSMSRWVASTQGKLMGYSDIDSNAAFCGGFDDKMDAYEAANMSIRIDPPQTGRYGITNVDEKPTPL